MTKEIIHKLLDELPEYWNKSSSSNLYNFLYSIALEFEEYDTQIDNMEAEVQIDTSSGQYLNELGRMFRLSRNPNETDEQLRARIKAYWPGFSGGGTIDAFKATLNRVTGVPESDIEIVEVDFMKVAIILLLDDENDYNLATTIVNLLENIKASGVKVFPNYILTGDTFLESFNVSDKIKIIGTSAGFWTAGVSSAGGTDVV
jgi:hypothetical protein